MRATKLKPNTTSMLHYHSKSIHYLKVSLQTYQIPNLYGWLTYLKLNYIPWTTGMATEDLITKYPQILFLVWPYSFITQFSINILHSASQSGQRNVGTTKRRLFVLRGHHTTDTLLIQEFSVMSLQIKPDWSSFTKLHIQFHIAVFPLSGYLSRTIISNLSTINNCFANKWVNKLF